MTQLSKLYRILNPILKKKNDYISQAKKSFHLNWIHLMISIDQLKIKCTGSIAIIMNRWSRAAFINVKEHELMLPHLVNTCDTLFLLLTMVAGMVVEFRLYVKKLRSVDSWIESVEILTRVSRISEFSFHFMHVKYWRKVVVEGFVECAAGCFFCWFGLCL